MTGRSRAKRMISTEPDESTKPNGVSKRLKTHHPVTITRNSRATGRKGGAHARTNSVASTASTSSGRGRRRRLPILNKIPQQSRERLNVYVFGSGSMAELGLGPEAKNKEVKRPRLNPFLGVDKVGIVEIACGGAHSIAIDHNGKVWTWGCNDHGVLGRDTSKVEEQLRDMDADESDDEDGDLNPLESTPGLVENLDDIKFVQVAGTDNLSVALSSEGRVFAWGTFRCNEGVLGFSEKVTFQRTPVLIPSLFDVVQFAAGKDHVLALTIWGTVLAWGNGQQYQLGRRVVERTRMQTLEPREFGLKNIIFVGSGEFHSFAINSDGRVLAWGLNQFGQCGIPSSAGEDGAVVSSPTFVEALDGKDIVFITGGEHHSVALDRQGGLYVFGRNDSHEVGISDEDLPHDTVRDGLGHARYIPSPTMLKNVPRIRAIACGSHHTIAISDEDGSPWSWGFGDSYQVGQGPTAGDINVPTKIDNTATRGVNMKQCGAGGQFSVIAGDENGKPSPPVVLDSIQEIVKDPKVEKDIEEKESNEGEL